MHWFKGFGNLYPEAIERVTIPRNAVPYVGPRGRGLPNESEAGFEDSAYCKQLWARIVCGFQRVTEKFPKASVDILYLLLGYEDLCSALNHNDHSSSLDAGFALGFIG